MGWVSGTSTMSTMQQILSDEEEDTISEAWEAYDGAYNTAPNGEGVSGAQYFGLRAAFLVIRYGMKAPEAVEKSIGRVGHYGVPRKYKLVPIENG
jgi:hypothetical protein